MRDGFADLGEFLRGAQTGDERGKIFGFSILMLRHVNQMRPFWKALGSSGQLVMLWCSELVADIARADLEPHYNSSRKKLTQPREPLVRYVVATVFTTMAGWLDTSDPSTPEQIDSMFRKLAIPGGAAGGLGPYLVAMLVWGIGLSLGGPTGYAINPARDLGPRIAHFVLPIPCPVYTSPSPRDS